MVDLQQEFERSRDMLRYNVGLELCLTELVLLRRIVGTSITALGNIRDLRNRYQPAMESACRFLQQEYGITDRRFYEPIIGGYYDEKIAEVLCFLQGQKRLI